MKTFQPPSILDIVEFVSGKNLGWPQSFVEYISEKFWNHYEAQGWVLSNRVPMKSWTAAFNSNWKGLPFEDDRKKLAEMKVKTMVQPVMINNSTDQTPAYIETLFQDFKAGRIDSYKWLRENGHLAFSAQETEGLIRDAGNEKWYGRFLSVRLFFRKLIEQGLTFQEYIKKQAI